MSLCDIGAGTGIFTFAAAAMGAKQVFALELSQSMHEYLQQRIFDHDAKNIVLLKSSDNSLPVDDNCSDMVLLVTVFHELVDPTAVLAEIRRILKVCGKLLIVEFHKSVTPMGPPLDHRIAEDVVVSKCAQSDFTVIDRFDLGDNLYALILIDDK